MHIVIKDGLCQGHGQCVDAAPDVFFIGDDDDLVHLRTDDPDDSLRPAVEDAVRRCPAEALALAEETGSAQ